CCRRAAASFFPSAEDAGSGPQGLPSFRPFHEACFTWEEVSTAITASFGLKETLMLHLFTATNDAFHQHLDGH
ncbi:hypothetical protein Cfor_02542, partial [Coptotermes formosanus]